MSAAAQFDGGLQRRDPVWSQTSDDAQVRDRRATQIVDGRIRGQHAQGRIGVANDGAQQFDQGHILRASLRNARGRGLA